MSCLLKTSPDIICLAYGVISGDVLFFKLIVFYTSDNQTVVVSVVSNGFVENYFCIYPVCYLFFNMLPFAMQYVANQLVKGRVLGGNLPSFADYFSYSSKSSFRLQGFSFIKFICRLAVNPIK